MMKRGTPRHPKTVALAALLKTQRHSAIGILELLWHFTAEFAHEGDIGRYPDSAIASALDWSGDSTVLIQSLVDSGWLDRCPCHRLRVHDWPDHADQTVERVLKRKNKGFLTCYHQTSMKLGQDFKNASACGPGLRIKGKVSGRNRGVGEGKDRGVDRGVGEGKITPTKEMAEKWLADWRKSGADYTKLEMESAFLALSANGWMWGKNPVVDFRAALERQIQTDRQRQNYGNSKTSIPNSLKGHRIVDHSKGF
jgi:hypothetical protein